MWSGIITLKPMTTDKVESVCSGIAIKDESFNFEINEGALIIQHEDRTVLYKKLVWLINKVEVLKGCKFKVIKDA